MFEVEVVLEGNYDFKYGTFDTAVRAASAVSDEAKSGFIAQGKDHGIINLHPVHRIRYIVIRPVGT